MRGFLVSKIRTELEIHVGVERDVRFVAANVFPNPLNVRVEVNVSSCDNTYAEGLSWSVVKEVSLRALLIVVSESTVNRAELEHVAQTVFKKWVKAYAIKKITS